MVNDFLVGILNGINSVVQNYGWSIVVFTILIKCLLMPFDYKSRKSMRRMTSLQPQITKLQKKYANDKEKLNQKTAELYRKERINPMSGCVPMLLSFPVLIAMFNAMRYVSNIQLAEQAIDLIVTGAQNSEGWLWVKNLWMPDSPFYGILPDQSNLSLISSDVWSSVFSSLADKPDYLTALAAVGIDANTITGESVFAVLQNTAIYQQEMALWATMPSVNLIFFDLNIFANNNGWFLLPLLSAGTQYLMTLTQPQTAPADPNSQQASTNKMMKYFFPLFSLWICSSYNAAFALYWVSANIFAGVQGVVLNKVFEKQEAQQRAAIEGDSIK